MGQFIEWQVDRHDEKKQEKQIEERNNGKKDKER
jgi:hypothetical protein